LAAGWWQAQGRRWCWHACGGVAAAGGARRGAHQAPRREQSRARDSIRGRCLREALGREGGRRRGRGRRPRCSATRGGGTHMHGTGLAASAASWLRCSHTHARTPRCCAVHCFMRQRERVTKQVRAVGQALATAALVPGWELRRTVTRDQLMEHKQRLRQLTREQLLARCHALPRKSPGRALLTGGDDGPNLRGQSKEALVAILVAEWQAGRPGGLPVPVLAECAVHGAVRAVSDMFPALLSVLPPPLPGAALLLVAISPGGRLCVVYPPVVVCAVVLNRCPCLAGAVPGQPRATARGVGQTGGAGGGAPMQARSEVVWRGGPPPPLVNLCRSGDGESGHSTGPLVRFGLPHTCW
jgi:hypothetical protein